VDVRIPTIRDEGATEKMTSGGYQQGYQDLNQQFYAPPQMQQPMYDGSTNVQAAASADPWFSGSNAIHSQQGYAIGGILPVAPAMVPAARPVTSVGFEVPSVNNDGFGNLGGSLSANKGVYGSGASNYFGLSTLDGEQPLLVELGVDFTTIIEKTKSALNPSKSLDPSLMSDGDIAGPFVFCLALGFMLMLAGKLQFGYVFGFGVAGCAAIYTVLNLMSQKETGIELHVVFSVLGYSLIPIVFLASVAVLVPLNGAAGWILVPPSILWCTVTATRFFEAVLGAREQRYLIAYPVFLFFACFALITVF